MSAISAAQGRLAAGEFLTPAEFRAAVDEGWALFRSVLGDHGHATWGLRLTRALGYHAQVWHRHRRVDVSAWTLGLLPTVEIETTALHEVAHINTPGTGHGPAWQAQAVLLGIPPVQWGPGYSALQYRHAAPFLAECQTPGCKRVCPVKRRMPGDRFTCLGPDCYGLQPDGAFLARTLLVRSNPVAKELLTSVSGALSRTV